MSDTLLGGIMAVCASGIILAAIASNTPVTVAVAVGNVVVSIVTQARAK